MLRIQSAARRSKTAGPAKVGLAIAGGGPLGGIYGLGTLRALEDCLTGVDLTDLHSYVGVSSGAFLAASLANHLTAGQMCRILINSDAAEHPFKPEIFVKPAYAEYLRSAAKLPKALAKTLYQIAKNPLEISAASLGQLGEVIPAGIFDNERVNAFLEQVFTIPGRTNDFRKLHQRLRIVAVELDTGVAVRFGAPGFDHVPISKAVQASAALPGLYPPVEIDQHYFVDGALRRTLHASAVLDEGIDLLIGLNPLVPYDARQPDGTRVKQGDSLVQAGLPTVLSQTFRSLIQSRMQIGIQKYHSDYPRTDLLLLEPDRNDDKMFFTNVFSYASRHELCDHAYQTTRADLRNQAEDLSQVLARHGAALVEDNLNDPERSFTSGLLGRSSNVITSKLNRALRELEFAVTQLR